MVNSITAVIDTDPVLFDKVKALALDAVVRGSGQHAEAYAEAYRVSEVSAYAASAAVYIRTWLIEQVWVSVWPQRQEAMRQLFIAMVRAMENDQWVRIGDMYLPEPEQVLAARTAPNP